MNLIDPKSIEGSALSFYFAKGKTLEERYRPLHEHILLRKANQVWQYSEVLASRIGAQTRMAGDNGDASREITNVAMTDYLGFSQHEQIIGSVSEAIDRWGVHATATPVVAGMTTLTMDVEAKLCEVLQQESATLFANGWSACFGVMAALVSKDDFVILDSLAHNSLATGAEFATQHVTRFQHNDLIDLEDKLKRVRAIDAEHAIFIVLETWYSVNSDGPDLARVMELSRYYECIVVIDNSHDFGCMGQRGLGVLEDIDLQAHENLVIAGSLSKCFAANGGFVASHAVVKERIRIYSQSYLFASAISPIQCAILLEALRIAFSQEGALLRSLLKSNYEAARAEFLRLGFKLDGQPSAIIPVVIGRDKLARLMGRALRQRGIHSNLAEFPVVPRNRAIFRFIVNATHSPEFLTDVISQFPPALQEAQEMLAAIQAQAKDA